MIVVFVDFVVVVGIYLINLFNFKYYGLNWIGLYVDNVLVGGNLLKFNFDDLSG